MEPRQVANLGKGLCCYHRVAKCSPTCQVLRLRARRLWTQGEDQVTLEHVCPEGPFPGTVTAQLTYRVAAGSTLSMEYAATTTAATPISLTNHAYWNLSAGAERTVRLHTISLLCDTYSCDDGSGNGVPTGEARAVEGTGRDMRSAAGVPLGQCLQVR